MTKLAAAAGVALLMLTPVACAPAEAPSAGAAGSAHTSQNSLDWAGTYRGILPCADCPGIETVLTLSQDGNFVRRTRYLGRDDQVHLSRGRFTWEANGGNIRLDGDEPRRYQVGEGRLISLALDGSPVTGSLAGNYVLTKQMPGSIVERQWRLVELHGQPIPKLEQTPYLILRAQDSRVTGTGGCNQFTGSYALDQETLRIRFSQMASTMRACLSGTDVDQAFTEALGQVDNFTMSGDSLSLNRARMAPLARLEALPLQ